MPSTLPLIAFLLAGSVPALVRALRYTGLAEVFRTFKALEAQVNGPRVGDTAPDFTLPRTFEESISLSRLLEDGPVLLHFYVFDFGSI
jgi:hypothetical protein